MYRYTSISTYERCPLQYKYMMEGHSSLDAGLMRDGSLAHKAYEAYAKHCIEVGRDTDITAMPTIVARDDIGITPYSDLYDTLIAPWLECHMFPAHEVVAVEKFIAIDANQQVLPAACFHEDIWVHGTIDLLRRSGEGVLQIVDYKTGFSTDANKLQMQIYAWLVMCAYPDEDVVECIFDYTRFNVQKSRTIYREDLGGIVDYILGVTDRMEEDAGYAAKPGEHCLTCNYRHSCTYKPECVEYVRDIEEARRAVEAISALQRDLEKQKALLRAWCSENGPVVHNGTSWGHHARGDEGFDDPAAFAAACTSNKVTPWPYMSVNNQQARKLRKKGEWPEFLVPLLANRRSTAFGSKKE